MPDSCAPWPFQALFGDRVVTLYLSAQYIFDILDAHFIWEFPEKVEVLCSGNIIKNVKGVTVPNSGGLKGIEAAVALGATGPAPERALVSRYTNSLDITYSPSLSPSHLY